MTPDLAFALQLADAADEISLAHFRTELVVERKPDSTPVTEVDRAVERELRRLLADARSEDAILGEEHGQVGVARRRWILDPVDGTRNYARGIPVWATLIALEEDGALHASVISAPGLGRRWWAERGGGAFAGSPGEGARIQVSRVNRVEDAVLSFAFEQRLPALAAEAWHVRGYGDFWAHMLVAEGAVDGAVDAVGVQVWDLAAVQLIVEEAGGRFSDFAGEPRYDSGAAVTSNGLLHDKILAAVAER